MSSRTRRPVAPSGTRRSVDAWIEAGLRRLVSDGLGGVRIATLAGDLGVTKGSFYWHFRDRGAFLRAMAVSWADGHVRRHVTAARAAGSDARARLRHLLALFVAEGIGPAARAMRDWGRTDAHVRRSVERADRAVLGFLVELFEDLGMDPRDAALRARILFWAGTGWHVVETPAFQAGAGDVERVLDLFLGRRDAAPVRARRGRAA